MGTLACTLKKEALWTGQQAFMCPFPFIHSCLKSGFMGKKNAILATLEVVPLSVEGK